MSDYVYDYGYATSVSAPGSVSGTIEGAAYSYYYGYTTQDEDWYALDLTAGTIYDFSLANAGMDGYLYLYDSYYYYQTYGDSGGLNDTDTLSFTPTTSGTYYVAVSAYYEYDTTSSYYTYGVGDFTLSVSSYTPATSNDYVGDYWYDYDIGSVSESSPASGTIDTAEYDYYGYYYADEDWYAISLAAGMSYDFSLYTYGMDGFIYLYDENGYWQTYGDSYGVGSTDTMSFTPTTSGTYYVGVTANYDYNTDDYGEGDFDLYVSSTSSGGGSGGSDTVGDYWYSPGNYGSVSVAGSVSGAIEGEVYSSTYGYYYGDEDWYTVSLTAGTTYRFSLSNSAMDGYLYLYDSGFNWQTWGDTYGKGSADEMYFTPSSSGTYYVAVGANYDYSTYDYGQGTFTLAVDTFSSGNGGSDTVGDYWYSPGNYGSVSVASSTIGTIDGEIYSSTYGFYYGDEDWYAVNLTAGLTYQFNLTNFDMDGAMSLYDTSGNWQTWGDTWGEGSTDSMYFTPSTSGTYYVGVGANWDYDTYDYGAGSFSLAVSGFTTGDDSSDTVGDYWYSPDNYGSLNAPGQVFGTINGEVYSSSYGYYYADEDWYEVALTAGTTYQFSLTNFDMDGTMSLYDASGNWQTWGDAWGEDSTDSMYFTPGASGTYYVGVGANWDYGDWDYGQGDFTLAVSSFSVGTESADTVGGFYDLWAYTDAGGWVQAADPNAKGEINAPGQVFGSINAPIVLGIAGNTYENSDQDWYGVSLTAGNTYQFSLTNFGMDGYLNLYDSSGGWLTWADTWGEEETDILYYTATTSGVHYIAVEANWEYGSYDATNGWYGDYGQGDFTLAVSVFEDEIDDGNDIADDEQTTGALTTTNDVRSQISATDDADWFAVDLDGGNVYTFSVSGLTLDSMLTLYDADGDFVSYADAGGSGGEETLTAGPGLSGTYYLGVEGWYDSTGSYDLSMTATVSSDEDIASSVIPGAGEQSAGIATPGYSYSSISQGDADWFNVRLEAGQSYQFELYTDATLDGILTLYDSRGEEVVDDDGYVVYADDSWYSGGSEVLYFTPETSGEYFIEVSGWDTTYGSYDLYSSETYEWSLEYGYDSLKWGSLDWSSLTDYDSVSWDLVEWDKVNTWDTLDWMAVDWNDIYASGTGAAIDYAAIDWTSITDDSFWDDIYFNSAAALDAEEWSQLLAALDSDKADLQTFFTNILTGAGNFTSSALNLDDTGNDCVILASGGSTKSVNGGAGLDYLQAADGTGATLDGGLGADNVVGGSGKDMAKGGEGNDVVEGGAGADKLEGGNGNDVMYGSDTDGSGSDGDAMKGGAGKDAMYGSRSKDALDGGDGADILDGGEGADVMKGGKGADIYYVNDAGDKCTDVSGDNTTLNGDDLQGARSGALSDLTAIKDKVIATISYVLATNIEDLTLEGSGNLDATGNKVANELIGNSGNNKLDGKEGSDVLTGGDGADTFVFSTKIGVSSGTPTNADTLADFDTADDTLLLKASIFKAKFATDGSSFHSGVNVATAADANDFLIYNETTGDLYYDADGSATKSTAIKFATLIGSPDDLSWSDFSIG